MNLTPVHPSWKPIIKQALANVDPAYLLSLKDTPEWLPGADNILNAFSRPLQDTRYILFGESPYPRAHSANGYAFWDQNVTSLWSPTGLSKPVNRATSLRNIIKMLLLGKGLLSKTNTSQEAIARIDKERLIQSNQDFFENFLKHGFLLLNASLVFRPDKVRLDAKAWHGFMDSVLQQVANELPDVTLILLGKVAEKINQLPVTHTMNKLCAEHPYNLSFITNQTVLDFFTPLALLDKR